MTVAIPVWNHMVSPVLDTAQVLRVYEVSRQMTARYEEHRLPVTVADKAVAIAECASVLICGALSGELARELDHRGITVHPWIMGRIDAVITGYVHGDISSFEYTMPGCRRMMRRCGGQTCRHRHGSRHRNGG